jgi:hypothetical protein
MVIMLRAPQPHFRELFHIRQVKYEHFSLLDLHASRFNPIKLPFRKGRLRSLNLNINIIDVTL